MFHNRQGKVLLILVVLALVVAVAAIITSKPNPAAAQMPPAMDEAPPPPPEPGPENYMQPPPPQTRWTRPSPMMGMASSGAAAIAAAGEYVYVVQGNTLYQFSARTLKLVNKTEFVQTTNRPTYPQENANPPRPAPER